MKLLSNLFTSFKISNNYMKM